MQRRSNATFGHVLFPIGKAPYMNSKEGGMVVKLVVLPSDPLLPQEEQVWDICCGVGVHDILTESLVADSALKPLRNAKPKSPKERNPLDALYDTNDQAKIELAHDLMQMDHSALMQSHYPHLEHSYTSCADDASTSSTDAYERIISTRYLACLVLGTTGWSGYNEEEGSYFCATYEDLTDTGKQLYDLMHTLYPGAQVRLLTFLDT